MAESPQESEYLTEPSSEEVSEDDTEGGGGDLPTPFLGRPYSVKKTFVNTMNKDVLKEICTGILKMKGNCITLESNSVFSLKHVLFSSSLAFSKIPGKELFLV